MAKTLTPSISETTQKVLTLMAGIDHPPFDSASVYLLDAKRLHSQLDAAKKKELRALLIYLQQTNDKEIIDFYANLKRHKIERTRRWLEGLTGTIPPELTVMLNTPPTEEACRRELHELAMECLKLIG